MKKWEKQQENRPTIKCGDKSIENTFKTKYLGSLFAVDGKQSYDIKSRITTTFTRCGQLSKLFDSPNLGPHLKIRIYAVAVYSMLTYECES